MNKFLYDTALEIGMEQIQYQRLILLNYPHWLNECVQNQKHKEYSHDQSKYWKVLYHDEYNYLNEDS